MSSSTNLNETKTLFDYSLCGVMFDDLVKYSFAEEMIESFWNWVEWAGTITDEEGNLSGATVKLKKGSITLDTYITEGNGHYEFREYVSTTDYLTLHVSKTNYTSESVHVLARDIGEPWIYDFTLYYVVKWAVIVGIEVYGPLADAPFSDNDADAWNTQLTNETGLDFDNVEVLKNDAATESAIKTKLNTMVSGADGGDIIAFIFSGHGYKYDEGDSYALSAYEADPDNPDNEGFFNDTELATIMENSIAERVFFFFDCCNASGMYNELGLLDNSDTFFLAAATLEYETSWWDESKQFRCWTQCFLHYSWNGNPSEHGYAGSITADFDYIFIDAWWWYNHYEAASVNFYNANQTPTRWNDYGNGFCLS